MCSKSQITLLFFIFLHTSLVYADKAYNVAGVFYPENKKILSTQIKEYLHNTDISTNQNIKAIVSPHAGYVFSAKTAAFSYKSLNKEYKNVFIIGSSHYKSFSGASIYNIDNYKTPIGEVSSNTTIISFLLKNKLFSYNKHAHDKEHSIEVQLPFLQTIFSENLNIVPILIGDSDINAIYTISQVLKPYFDNPENLFVISSDLSHYPKYRDANYIDIKTLQVLAKNSSKEFINYLSISNNPKNRSLSTYACGWSSLLTLLYMSENENYSYELLDYKNSGDTPHGDKNRVVGYGALSVYKDTRKFHLTKNEKNILLEIAKLALYETTINDKEIQINANKLPTKLKQNIGAFVTLYKNDKLRGCIGTFNPQKPLYKVIVEMAIAAARKDSRFSIVSEKELNDISIEISVLTPRKKINSIKQLILGKHGIYIQKGVKNGTLLPHVATNMKWSKEEFLRYCAEEKAGIKMKNIKDSDVYIYETIVF